MRTLYLKILIIFLVLTLNLNICYAKKNVKMIADVDADFTIKNTELPDRISFKTAETRTIPDVISIPENSTVTLEIIRTQRELRWHKSGIVLCKLVEYTPEGLETPIDVSDKDIYLVVRKYEKIDKKEAFLIGTELVIMQGASFFAPGADIGYYFIKGAIQRKKHPHWFKAGVRNAYENSICWFWLKGKPMVLQAGEQVQIKDIKTKKVDKLIKKIDKRNARFERQAAKRIVKRDNKAYKRQIKNNKKMVNCSVTEDVMDSVFVERSVEANIVGEDVTETSTDAADKEPLEYITNEYSNDN